MGENQKKTKVAKENKTRYKRTRATEECNLYNLNGSPKCVEGFAVVCASVLCPTTFSSTQESVIKSSIHSDVENSADRSDVVVSK